MESGDYRMSDSLHHLARLRTWGEVVTDSKNSLSEQIGEVIPVGRPAKVGPIRGEYVPEATPIVSGVHGFMSSLRSSVGTEPAAIQFHRSRSAHSLRPQFGRSTLSCLEPEPGT
jgi:hypothetical protein